MTIDVLDLNLGWRRVVKVSKKQFVPDLLSLKDYNHNLNDNLNKLKSSLSVDYQPHKHFFIDQPKANFSLRPGLVINVEDRIIYQAIIDYIAPIVDPHLSNSVYSYRLSDKYKDPYFFKNQVHQWKFYREARRKYYVEEGYTYLLETDIAAFFEHISHKILIEKLKEYIQDEEILHLLKNFISYWSSHNIQGMGLPQNSIPSSFLGNFYLKYIDDIILREDIDCKYSRFADDISIFTRNKGDLKKILKILVQELRKLNLNIQDKKTKMYEKTEIENLIDDKQDIIQAIEYGIDNSSINPMNFKELTNLFKSTINNPDKFNKTHFNFCITRFKKIKNDYAVDFILSNLEAIPQSSDLLIIYLRLFIDTSDKIKKSISYFLSNPEVNIYEWQEMWFLILLLKAKNLNKSQISLIRKISKDRNKHWAVRTYAILTLGKHGDESDREYIKIQYVNEENIYVKKAILIACHKINKSERNFFYNIASKENNLEINRTIDFLKSRSKLAWSI